MLISSYKSPTTQLSHDPCMVKLACDTGRSCLTSMKFDFRWSNNLEHSTDR